MVMGSMAQGMARLDFAHSKLVLARRHFFFQFLWNRGVSTAPGILRVQESPITIGLSFFHVVSTVPGQNNYLN